MLKQLNPKPWLVFLYKILLSNFNLLKSPFRYTIVVTKNCNSRCSNCSIWQETPSNELTLNDFEKIAKSAGSDLCWLHITGGEPTDRADLPDIIRAFKAHCPNLVLVNFSTNGLRPGYIDNVVKQVAALKIPVFAVNVSLDGPRAINDQLRGIKGSFDKVIDTYKRLKKQSSVRTMFAMTLFENNFNLIEETFLDIKSSIPEFQKSSLHINLSHRSEHFYGNQHAPSLISPTTLLVSAVQSFTQSFSNNLNPLTYLERTYLKKISEYFKTKKTPVPCVAMMSSIYISEKGDLYPCTIWNKNLGSVLQDDQSVKDLLASDEGKTIRKMIRESSCDNCWSPCEAFPSILGNVLPFK